MTRQEQKSEKGEVGGVNKVFTNPNLSFADIVKWIFTRSSKCNGGSKEQDRNLPGQDVVRNMVNVSMYLSSSSTINENLDCILVGEYKSYDFLKSLEVSFEGATMEGERDFKPIKRSLRVWFQIVPIKYTWFLVLESRKM